MTSSNSQFQNVSNKSETVSTTTTLTITGHWKDQRFGLSGLCGLWLQLLLILELHGLQNLNGQLFFDQSLLNRNFFSNDSFLAVGVNLMDNFPAYRNLGLFFHNHFYNTTLRNNRDETEQNWEEVKEVEEEDEEEDLAEFMQTDWARNLVRICPGPAFKYAQNRIFRAGPRTTQNFLSLSLFWRRRRRRRLCQKKEYSKETWIRLEEREILFEKTSGKRR